MAYLLVGPALPARLHERAREQHEAIAAGVVVRAGAMFSFKGLLVALVFNVLAHATPRPKHVVLIVADGKSSQAPRFTALDSHITPSVGQISDGTTSSGVTTQSSHLP